MFLATKTTTEWANILTNLTVTEFIILLDTPKLRQGTLCVKHYSTPFIIEGFSEKIVWYLLDNETIHLFLNFLISSKLLN